MAETRLLWDVGTAYDLFVSLWVLHEPAMFGARASWAAGVRARLPVEERDTLERAHRLVHLPLPWIYALPEPRDGAAVLWTLSQTPAAGRLQALTARTMDLPAGAAAVLEEVAARGRWSEADREAFVVACRSDPECDHASISADDMLTDLLDTWSRSEEFGERYLAALRAYHDAFFAEEETHIAPALRQALLRAQELAGRMDLLDLLEELSQGLRFDEPPEAPELVLAPSYWSTPLMVFGTVKPGREIRLFGARPASASLVPGEVVPDALLQALKALADPTRLRILRYLAREPLTQAELARRLRLRAPTVTHHLQALRLAGLVQLKLGQRGPAEGKDSRRYAARAEAPRTVFDSLRTYMTQGDE